MDPEFVEALRQKEAAVPKLGAVLDALRSAIFARAGGDPSSFCDLGTAYFAAAMNALRAPMDEEGTSATLLVLKASIGAVSTGVVVAQSAPMLHRTLR